MRGGCLCTCSVFGVMRGSGLSVCLFCEVRFVHVVYTCHVPYMVVVLMCDV